MRIKITKQERFTDMPFCADILDRTGSPRLGFGRTPEDALIDVLREYPPTEEDTIEIIRGYKETPLKLIMAEDVYIKRMSQSGAKFMCIGEVCRVSYQNIDSELETEKFGCIFRLKPQYDTLIPC